MTDAVLAARARILHDLSAYGLDSAPVVSLVEAVLTERRWWVEQWPEGAAFVCCLVAQDVQEAVLDHVGRWPMCAQTHDDEDAGEPVEPHELRVTPDLGEDPHWMCEEDGVLVAPVGALPPVV